MCVYDPLQDITRFPTQLVKLKTALDGAEVRPYHVCTAAAPRNTHTHTYTHTHTHTHAHSSSIHAHTHTHSGSAHMEMQQAYIPRAHTLTHTLHTHGEADVEPSSHRLASFSPCAMSTQVLSIVGKEPRLLWTTDVDVHVTKVLDKLVAIYPYKSDNKREEVIKIVQVW